MEKINFDQLDYNFSKTFSKSEFSMLMSSLSLSLSRNEFYVQFHIFLNIKRNTCTVYI